MKKPQPIYQYGQKWVRLHEQAGKPTHAYIATKNEGEVLIMMAYSWPHEIGNPVFFLHVTKLYEHWRLADKGIQGELFLFQDKSMKAVWRKKHIHSNVDQVQKLVNV